MSGTEVADGVFRLTPFPYMNVYALRGAEGWTIVDAAIGGVAKRLHGMLRSIGVRPGDVENVVLTHGHFDHAGGAEALREAFAARRVLAGAADVGPIAAGRNASGVTPSVLAKLDRIDPGYRPVPGVEAITGSIALGDDRTMVPFATPGHTDGHLSFHLPEHDVVLGGDAVFNIFTMRTAPGMLCSDAVRNRSSILAIADRRPTSLLVAHGPPIDGDVQDKLRSLAA